MSYSETSYNAWVYSQLEPNDKIVVGRKSKKSAGWYQIMTAPIELTSTTDEDYEYLNEDDI